MMDMTVSTSPSGARPDIGADTVVLIPAYDPIPALIDTVRELRGLGISCLVVNDGSHAACDDIFVQAAQYAQVVGYPKNGGKGVALRYGIARLREMYPFCRYFVTADADGQHAVADIVRVAETVREGDGFVIGSREFTGEVPFRSKLGNSMSRIAYACFADRYLRDNQSGLRAFPVTLCDWLLCIPGARYDYEINVLMYAARQNVHIHELSMHTIYTDGNKSSHFHMIKDTFRLHRRILLGSIPTLIGAFVSLWLCLVLVPLSRLHFGLTGFRLAVITAGSVGLLLGEGITFLRYRRVADVRMHFNPVRFVTGVFRLAAYQMLLEYSVFWLGWPVWAVLPGIFVVETVCEYWLKRFLAHKRRVVKQ